MSDTYPASSITRVQARKLADAHKTGVFLNDYRGVTGWYDPAGYFTNDAAHSAKVLEVFNTMNAKDKAKHCVFRLPPCRITAAQLVKPGPQAQAGYAGSDVIKHNLTAFLYPETIGYEPKAVLGGVKTEKVHDACSLFVEAYLELGAAESGGKAHTLERSFAGENYGIKSLNGDVLESEGGTKKGGKTTDGKDIRSKYGAVVNTYSVTAKSQKTPDLYRIKRQDGQVIAECLRGPACKHTHSENELISIFGHGTQNINWWGMPLIRMYAHAKSQSLNFELLGVIWTVKDKAVGQSITVTTDTGGKSSVDSSVFDGFEDEATDTYGSEDNPGDMF